MNNNLIITHKDGRTWNEGQLGDLFQVNGIPCLFHGFGEDGERMWYVDFRDKIFRHLSVRSVPLDPSLYTVSLVGMIAVEKVREFLKEATHIPYEERKVLQESFDVYLGEEN